MIPEQEQAQDESMEMPASAEETMLREIHEAVVVSGKKPVWVPQKDIPLLAGKTRAEMETFRKNNKGIWKNNGSGKKPSYVYDLNAF